ncbi:SDR family NAD(P)-dependent oxidoreductase [Nocardioides sp. Kera G14]|uniref:SDR family NAD(P)-dependent oxidoreductase n=1 Tax=Nocardioides sp. Kera G14 TaxID=2884264 RepID=UPI001D1032FE|nr:SDR family NAD(P)-dependent oxidoreductase [Nocardioides sp. Kera G14]UDY22257.1 SDR family oxidoreductase [Nocardioides sp. Kera G14]
MSAGPLTGRRALVTGASRGIGLAVAHRLVAEGTGVVVVNGRDPEALDEAVAALRAIATSEQQVSGIAGSASDADVLAAMVESAGEPDLLVTCAGTAEPPGSSILSITPDEWRDLIEAHLDSTFIACRAVVPGMVERRRGTIVTTSSHAFTGAFGGTGYAAGKGGVNSLTYALAAELREHGIRVNAVTPGARTRLSTGEDYEQTIGELNRRGLLDDLMREGALAPAPPEYVASLYAFLASDLSAPITGEVFSGSGGYVGRWERPTETFLTWRDHATEPPWSLDDLAGLISPKTDSARA